MVDQNLAENIAAAIAGLLPVMRKRSGWPEAVERLRNLAASCGDAPNRAAEAYGEVYRGCRGAMVFDVVISRQRKYQSVVLPRIEKWAAAVDEPSLAMQAKTELEAKQFGLRRTEPETIQTVTANLLTFCQSEGLSEDAGCRAWAEGPKVLSTRRGWTRWSAVCPGSVRHFRLHAHAMWRRRFEARPPCRQVPPRTGIRGDRRGAFHPGGREGRGC